MNFECRLTQLVRLTRADGQLVDSWLILGEVVAAHIDPTYLEDGVYQTAQAHPILRAGGPGDYIEVRPDAVFTLFRPR